VSLPIFQTLHFTPTTTHISYTYASILPLQLYTPPPTNTSTTSGSTHTHSHLYYWLLWHWWRASARWSCTTLHYISQACVWVLPGPICPSASYGDGLYLTTTCYTGFRDEGSIDEGQREVEGGQEEVDDGLWMQNGRSSLFSSPIPHTVYVMLQVCRQYIRLPWYWQAKMALYQFVGREGYWRVDEVSPLY